jgi:hypothetical protein
MVIGFVLLSFVVGDSTGQSMALMDGEQQAAEFSPNIKPTLALTKTDGPIVIDGDLKDPGWANAARAVNFAQNYPGDQTKPPVDIEAWTTYDDESIYFAFIIRDDPGAVRANLSDRDRIFQDDYVGVIMDTYGDNAWAYFIAANPLGIQGDTRIVSNGPEDVTFDIVFSSEGRVTASGYQVEMAVPFRSLRFPEREVQDWNMTFWITHPRQSRAQYTWAAINRDDPCWFCQFGTLTGIRGVSGGGGLELLPAITGSQSGTLRSSGDASSGIDNGKLSADPSLGLKYAVSSNLTADVAVNPDFSQIEADAAQIDVNTTFALFFQERRPFFQEGSELFQTWVPTVYTRSINNPVASGKVTARYGRTSVGYIGGVDRDSPLILPFEEQSDFVQAGRSVSNIIRARRSFGTSSHVGALITDRRLTDDNGSGTTVSLDSRLRLSNNYSVALQFVGSHTAEPNSEELSESVSDITFDSGKHTARLDGESFSGFASQVSFERSARHWNVDLDYAATSPTFRADNGFITQNNLHRTTLWTGYTFYLDGIVERIMPAIVTGYFWNFDGVRKDKFLWLQGHINLKAQTNVGVRWLVRSDERFRGVDFQGLRRLSVNVNSNFSDPVKLGAFMNVGRSIARNRETPVMGRSLDLEFWGTIKPISRLVLEPSLTYASLDEDASGEEVFSGFIVRTRVNLQFTRRLFVRLVTQYNDFSERFELDPLITYKINPFTAFYVGSTHDYDSFSDPYGVRLSERQFFFKFQYLVRV